MKKTKLLTLILAMALIFTATKVLAANPLAVLITQRNAADTSNITVTLLKPTTGTSPVIGFDPTSNAPQYFSLGTGLAYSSSTLLVNNLPIANVTGLQAALDSKGTSSFSGAFTDLTGKPTTLSGYGITDAYPLSGNPSGFLTSVTSTQVTTALGYTPYNATNPSGYITSGALSSYTPTSGLGSAAFAPTSQFATSAQGTLATTSVQPGANISIFVNNSGYLTSAPVTSVAGKTGTVTLVKADVGLSNVDNTSDVNKPVSTAQATSIATKYTIPTGTTLQVVLGNGTLGTLPVVPTPGSSTYQSLISQSGTAAPIGSALVNDFGATTFTWARTGVGTYTITASAATFTANKTAIIMSNPNNPLAAFRYTVTSSTVLTLTTSIQAVLSLLLTATNTDGLLANTMFYVVVYP